MGLALIDSIVSKIIRPVLCCREARLGYLRTNYTKRRAVSVVIGCRPSSGGPGSYKKAVAYYLKGSSSLEYFAKQLYTITLERVSDKYKWAEVGHLASTKLTWW